MSCEMMWGAEVDVGNGVLVVPESQYSPGGIIISVFGGAGGKPHVEFSPLIKS